MSKYKATYTEHQLNPVTTGYVIELLDTKSGKIILSKAFWKRKKALKMYKEYLAYSEAMNNDCI